MTLQVIKAEDVREGEPRRYYPADRVDELELTGTDLEGPMHLNPFVGSTHGWVAVVDRPAPRFVMRPSPAIDLDALEASVRNPAADFVKMPKREALALIAAARAAVPIRAERDSALDSMATAHATPAKCHDEIRVLRAKLAEAKRLGMEACNLADGAVSLIDGASIDDDNESPRAKRDLRRIRAALDAL